MSYLIGKKNDAKFINAIYVRNIYINNRLYREYYKIIYETKVMKNYVLYKEVGEQILYRQITNIYKSRFVCYDPNEDINMNIDHTNFF